MGGQAHQTWIQLLSSTKDFGDRVVTHHHLCRSAVTTGPHDLGQRGAQPVSILLVVRDADGVERGAEAFGEGGRRLESLFGELGTVQWDQDMVIRDRAVMPVGCRHVQYRRIAVASAFSGISSAVST